MAKDACRHCRRPLHWVDDVGWLHGELPQYAHEEPSCDRPEPVCEYEHWNGPCERRHIEHGPDPACTCRCHLPAADRSRW